MQSEANDEPTLDDTLSGQKHHHSESGREDHILTRIERGQ
jgi:hypothetical protein